MCFGVKLLCTCAVVVATGKQCDGLRVFMPGCHEFEVPWNVPCRHPEKNAFEWTLEKHIPHDPEAIEVTQEVANLIIQSARKNRHKPASRSEEEDLLIYNWRKEFSGKRSYSGEEVDFDEIYIFPDAETFMAQQAERAQRRAARSM